ncbi:hypothetical protein F4777DRAFT_594118 [Nemania sp. FL0916]|nr:hypothetical protein F4777DRAFT_594118 [Nemania sp. FL0916]
MDESTAHTRAAHEDAEPGTQSHDEQPGTIGEVKRLYNDIRKSWVDYKPAPKAKDVPRASADTGVQREKYAIVHRMRRDDDDDDEWETSTIEIRSRLIKSALKIVFAGYPIESRPALEHDELPLIVRRPFYPFCHRWDELEGQLATSSGEKKRHIQLLVDTLEPELKAALETKKLYAKTGCINFYGVERIFQPGWTMIRNVHGVYAAGVLHNIQLIGASLGNIKWKLTVNTLKYNGHQFGCYQQIWTIDQFEGYRYVRDGSVFPVNCHPDKSKISEDLSDRGQRYIELVQRQHVKFYPHGSERIIVDVHGHYVLCEKTPEDLKPLENLGSLTHPEAKELNIADRRDKNDNCGQPTKSQQMYAEPTITAFGLKSKRWLDVPADGIKDVEWNMNAIENLELGQTEKGIILGLISGFNSDQARDLDSSVLGQGKGIIMLFHGPPGTGKTLTAECVSEHLRKPLYVLGAGDLGTVAQRAELSLQKAFERCTWWNATLLIDESDVFLEKRKMDSLSRNEIVSIFLRLVENYRGIMIFTTNRLKSIDLAFESRIDLILAYEDLSPESRKALWRKFLERYASSAGQTGIILEDPDYEELAAYPLNGRQIKSVVKVAMRVAENKKEILKRQGLEEVINIRLKALRDIKG